MAEEIAILATYIDTQYMKGSGAIRFIFEIERGPDADEAQKLMGLPNPEHSYWFAITKTTLKKDKFGEKPKTENGEINDNSGETGD